ncbi:hypothetical protein F4813DRAFT_215619 [Daldinia decipiens]|uniref:uncharacterized protein n=1 Tax=Daldinia decipiens TaxID=326647 RepID=UPI0020C4BFB6|nr:uncharacterized protein F4813DRAFT_215619 [Daldinia decipiens]KAI1654161.1 hypothetical protein F4813DRAFT_215619 [Daldinia decipiens]
MPPKRPAASAGTSRKKAKTLSDEPPKSKRWSAVSGSANADADYKTIWEKPDKWYSFVTICPPIPDDDDDEDEDEDEDKEQEEEVDEDDPEDESRDGPRCTRKGCICSKPAGENPDHPWVVSRAGYRKYSTQNIHFSLRNPDYFDMYTYNDHVGYGCVQIVQNLVLDYVEAVERGWREQWAVCEGLGLWLLSSASGRMMMIDDGECVDQTMRLIGRMFLDMLAQLDGLNLVGDATDVKSLGTVMAIYLKIASEVRSIGGILEEDDDDRGGRKPKFQANHFDDAILSYANQRGVTLQGPEDIDEITANLEGEVELPKKNAKDPWGFKTALKIYEKNYGKGKPHAIGGDDLDITTWTSSQRKQANFDHKDPLGKREIDAIKKGMVMQLG